MPVLDCFICRFVLREGDFPLPGSSIDGRNLTDLIMKNYELKLLALMMQWFHLIGKLVSLHKSVDSMSIDL